MSTTSTNTLYFVRHGENPANITHEFSYKLVDYSLTPKGVLQAQQTATCLKELPLDAIYASPLKRAYETAQIIAEPHKLPVTTLEGFREVNVGDLELLPPDVTTWQWHNRIIADWFAGKWETTFPNGENFLELRERTRNALREAIGERANQHIVITAHGGSITAIVRHICSIANNRISYTNMYNCAVTTIELTIRDGNMSGILRSWASTTHLSGEAAPLVVPALASEKAPS